MSDRDTKVTPSVVSSDVGETWIMGPATKVRFRMFIETMFFVAVTLVGVWIAIELRGIHEILETIQRQGG